MVGGARRGEGELAEAGRGGVGQVCKVDVLSEGLGAWVVDAT